MQSSEHLKTAPPDPASYRIDRDCFCVHCQYNLRTLPSTANCPECNTPVARSVRGPGLMYANSTWVKQLGLGGACMLMAPVVGVLELIVCIPFDPDTFTPVTYPVAVFVLAWLPVAIFSCGLHIATTPEFAKPALESPWRYWVRMINLALLVLVTAAIALIAASNLAQTIVILLTVSLCGAQIMLAALWLKRLMDRVDRHSPVRYLPWVASIGLTGVALSIWGVQSGPGYLGTCFGFLFAFLGLAATWMLSLLATIWIHGAASDA